MIRRLISVVVLFLSVLGLTAAFAQGPAGMGMGMGMGANGQPSAMDLRFADTAPAIGELVPDISIVDDQGNPVNMRELATGQYTVLTLGCLT
jgi:hypothetical protein